MTFKPIKPKKYFDNKLASEIINWEWAWYYKPILDILKPDFVINSSDILQEALKSGQIYYQNGAFYGKFNNKISLELEKIGAKYSRYGRCYRITQNKIPNELLFVIETNKAQVYSRVTLIKALLDNLINSTNELIKHLKMEDVVHYMFMDLQKRTYDNFKAHKIQTISPKLTDFRANVITKNYIENLEFYIKKWQPEEMIKMREVVSQMAIDGVSRKTIAQYIENQFKVSQRKAKFLARNESSIAVAEYLKAKYTEEGFTHFKWITNMDGRERELHKELNGKVFRFDTPPVIYIDQKKGTSQTGLPGETYNCRCSFIPVVTKDMIERRRAMSRK